MDWISFPMDLDLLKNESGWSGMFTREQASGAIPNGAHVVKALHEPGDATAVGSIATVLGSIGVPEGSSIPGYESVRYFYFVEWQRRPRVACGIVDYKIRARP